jgi:hypothetical protein
MNQGFPRRAWLPALSIALAWLSFSLGTVGLADDRGSASRIDRFLNLYYRHPYDVKIKAELGANYAVKYSDTATDHDRDLARKYLKEAEKLDPKAAAPVAWLGLVRCVDGREKASEQIAKEGLTMMDTALSKDGNNLDLRMLRASTAVEAPESFKRLDRVIADLEFVLKRVKADPSQAKIYDIDLSEVHLILGLAYRAKDAMDKARGYWAMAAKEGPDTTFGKRAAKLLKKYPAPR